MTIDKKYIDQFINVTSKAAIASYHLVGKKDKIAADQAAVDAMRTELNKINMTGEIVIGEGSLDEAPMLFTGEILGLKKGPKFDIAVDPLEGTNFAANNLPGALSVIAVAEKGNLLKAPETYMHKIATAKVEKGLIDLDAKSEFFSHGPGLRYEHGEWLIGKWPEKHLKEDAKIKLPHIFKENVGTPKKLEKFINPSNLIGSKSIQGFDKVIEGDGAKLFGTIVHLLLEKLPKSNSDDWHNIVPNLLKWAEINVSEETQIKAYKQAERILKNPSFEFIFAADTLAEVQFSTIVESVGGIPIVGVIDRLVLSQESALIIDFKTNQEVPSSIDEVPLGILKQMGAYAASMQKVFPKKNIELGIIWTHSAELMKIDVNRAVSSLDSIRMT